jgi:hypothetical protein
LGLLDVSAVSRHAYLRTVEGTIVNISKCRFQP